MLPDAEEVNPRLTIGQTVTSNEVETESPQLLTKSNTTLKVPEVA